MTEEFVRTHTKLADLKICNRHQVNPELTALDSAVPGPFLGSLWARFGAPDPSDGGYSYLLEHPETGTQFCAYYGPSGASYRAVARSDELLRVLERFEAWLGEVPPVDCSYEYEEEFGRVRAGMRNGEPFFEELPTNTAPLPDPTQVHSVNDCVGMLPALGQVELLCFVRAFEDALGVAYRDWEVSFTRSPQTITVADLGLDAEPVPIEQIDRGDWSDAAKLWLEAYLQWRQRVGATPVAIPWDE